MNSKLTVLLVDDEEGILDYLQFELEDAGYRVLTAANGLEALAVLANEPVDTVAAIISDIRMPKMDGVTFLKRLRDTRPLPLFVFMTGFADFDKQVLIDLGAAAVLEKPIDMKLFKSLMETLSPKS